MGTDPKTSALNRYLQSWDVPNLFVMGATAFPQNAGYNPTGTVAALAYWSAEAIRDQYLEEAGAAGRCVAAPPRSIGCSARAPHVPLLRRSLQGARRRHARDSQEFAQIENGRYLAIAADCAGMPHDSERGKSVCRRPCHRNAVRQHHQPRTSRRIARPALATWTDDDFDDAVRRGIRPDGSAALSGDAVHRLHQDVARRRAGDPRLPHDRRSRSTIQMMRTAAAVSVQHPGRDAGVECALFHRGGIPSPIRNSRPEWNRGAFLVEGPGHCGACHTPKSFLGGDKTSEYLRGSNLQGWFAPDITNDDRRGLGHWSADDIVAYLKTGHNRITAATGPMAEEITHVDARR